MIIYNLKRFIIFINDNINKINKIAKDDTNSRISFNNFI